MKTKSDWEMCKCKKFGGYSIGYICLMCHKHIYTKKCGEEVDRLRSKEDRLEPSQTEQEARREEAMKVLAKIDRWIQFADKRPLQMGEFFLGLGILMGELKNKYDNGSK